MSKNEQFETDDTNHDAENRGSKETPVTVNSYSEEINGEECVVYVFEQAELGKIGRILVQPVPGGQTRFKSEIFGAEDDPLTEKRERMFLPISEDFFKRYDEILASIPEENHEEKDSSSNGQWVKSKFLECDQCGKTFFHLVDAFHVQSKEKLEEIRKQVYQKAKEAGFPTWILGAPLSKNIPIEKTGSRMLQVFPGEDHNVKLLKPEEFDRIIRSHAEDCSNHRIFDIGILENSEQDFEKMAKTLQDYMVKHQVQGVESSFVDDIAPYLGQYDYLLNTCPDSIFQGLVKKYPMLLMYDNIQKQTQRQ